MKENDIQPTTVAPSTRVTVAFPFSNIKIHEPDKRVSELATIVAELADQLAELGPTEVTRELRRRARACVVEMAG